VSTENIKQVIRRFRAMSATATDGWKNSEDEALARRALDEVSAIERAAQDLTEWHKPGHIEDANELRRHARAGNEGFALLARIAEETNE